MLDNTNDKKMPPFIKRVFNFKAEHNTWAKAGKPVRSQERIYEIYHDHCEPCEHFNGKSCVICGCYINTGTNFNKILWATTKCPDDPPKWEEETNIPEEEKEKEAEAVESTASLPEQPEIKQHKPKGGCGCGG